VDFDQFSVTIPTRSWSEKWDTKRLNRHPVGTDRTPGFTTVHANNVVDVLGRFLNMGVDAYN
jgi:hypothetical protein